MFIGNYSIDDSMTFYAAGHGSSGAVDADSDPTYRIYQQGESTVIATGTMALLDASNTDGFYSATLTLSSDNGFVANKRYTILITGTFEGVVINTGQYFTTIPDTAVSDIFGHAYEDTETFEQFLRLVRSVLYGKSAYNGTDSVEFIAKDGTTTRLTVTLGTGDDRGDRTAVSVDDAT